MKFTLTIEMGNDAMLKYGDVAEALQRVVKRLNQESSTNMDGVDGPVKIRDLNGNTVGAWEVA